MDLPLIWILILGFGIFMYVLLDGFDLGIGLLFPFAAGTAERDVMMQTVAPVWDGNETWLVLGGAILFGAFPVAYAVALPALYMPLVTMLLGLIFRGVAFEFRFKARRRRHLWGLSFAAGSAVATFSQGVVLGAFVTGLPIEGTRFTGNPLDWLSPFSLMTGTALMAGYALLGATWLVMKTEGRLQDWSFQAARRLTLAVAGFIALVSLWTPLAHPAVAARWFTLPNIFYLLPVPLATVGVVAALWSTLHRRREVAPFGLAIGLFLLSYLGLGVSLWPYIVPRVLTFREAAAPAESQIFLLVGVVLLLPVILAYTLYSYRVFRGKVTEDAGYH